ncbi:hypothetical protein [Senegalia massiliensis]|uniref:Uncharacterized protein n=1 Tax=Senegalia massiliensis TaxID=1720316 RepID=A0A845QZ13_9CLOT|nr:hypothetical protein [Senegalia massiliensis]NBI07541.1 hypothetical protein [Senegalia massiliensis]
MLEMVKSQYLEGSSVTEDIDVESINLQNSKRDITIDLLKEKLLNKIADVIINSDIEIISSLGNTKIAILELLDLYSLEELFYFKRGLEEYETLGEYISEDNLFSVNEVSGQLSLLINL